MPSRPAAAMLAAASALLGLVPVVHAQSCERILPDVPEIRSEKRPLDPADLAALRDIGENDLAFPGAGTIAMSPDGAKLAFQLRQGDPASNTYCLAMVVMDARPGAKPVVVDQGGELIRMSFDFRGKAGFPTGTALPIAPRWSPDGRWIAFLKRAGAHTQVWRANVEGGRSEPLTESPTDVEAFQLSEDGQSVLYKTRPGMDEGRRSIEQEGRSGFHFDDRFSPMSSARPFVPEPVGSQVTILQLGTGLTRAATESEVAHMNGLADAPKDAVAFVRARSGRRAWTESQQQPQGPARLRLYAEDAHGRPQLCSACGDRIVNVWWIPGTERLRFFQREGWASSMTAIYEWSPGREAPRRLFLTKDVLADCLPRGADMICLHEAARLPRRVVRLRSDSNHMDLLFDPNPEFTRLKMGTVERLEWRNEMGIETFGDLVLPVGYQKGVRYPLIVVQYVSRGFLRGGTGDEYPIQAFANRGYAVLSFSRPRSVGSLSGATTGVEIDRRNLVDFADRRSVHSSLTLAIGSLIKRGIVDPDRVGITGLSDGASTVQFALINSKMFAAAAVSSPGFDPSMAMAVGPAAAREFAAEGYPLMTENDPAFWDRISLAKNARAIRTPILMQLPDDEYLAALETVTAFREVYAPIDVFIFPGEHHVKWQPAHRLAIYRRSLDWFDFWLKDAPTMAPERQAEIRHWNVLKRASDAGGRSRPPLSSAQSRILPRPTREAAASRRGPTQAPL